MRCFLGYCSLDFIGAIKAQFTTLLNYTATSEPKRSLSPYLVLLQLLRPRAVPPSGTETPPPLFKYSPCTAHRAEQALASIVSRPFLASRSTKADRCIVAAICSIAMAEVQP